MTLSKALCLALVLATLPALAEPPNLVPYVGYLDYSGSPVNGNIAMQFRIVDATGAVKWGPETYDASSPVAVVSGRFSVALGTKAAIPPSLLQGTNELYITVSVGTLTGTQVTWVALAGRQRLLATPYALTAATAKDLSVSGNLTVASNVTASGTITGATLAATGSVTAEDHLVAAGSVGVGGAVPTKDGVVQFPAAAGDKVLLGTNTGLATSSAGASVFLPSATSTLSVRTTGATPTEGFKATAAGDVTIAGRLETARGVTRGSPTLDGTDLGLYQQVPDNWMRFVTNGGRIAWFQDGNYGTTAAMSLEPGGKLNVPACRLCLRWRDDNGNGNRKSWACVKMSDGATSGWFNLGGDVDGNDQFSLKWLCDGGGNGTGSGDGP